MHESTNSCGNTVVHELSSPIIGSATTKEASWGATSAPWGGDRASRGRDCRPWGADQTTQGKDSKAQSKNGWCRQINTNRYNKRCNYVWPLYCAEIVASLYVLYQAHCAAFQCHHWRRLVCDVEMLEKPGGGAGQGYMLKLWLDNQREDCHIPSSWTVRK